MKITHINLCGPVTDGWSYQDNLLPKFHKKMGLTTSLITSQFIQNKDGTIEIEPSSEYYNKDDIKMIRLKAKHNASLKFKFKQFHNVYNAIKAEEPDILFIHGVQFLDIISVVKYLKKHQNVKVYVDNHADFSNSATNWVSLNVLHRIIWRYFANKIKPYTRKFYGVLPARVDFLLNEYNLPKDKVELLVMGADDELVSKVKNNGSRKKIRSRFNVSEDDFLIITGGKIDSSKRQVLTLIKAVQEIKNVNLKLIVFGSVSENLKTEFNSLLKDNVIEFIGWKNNEEISEFLNASDLAIFPGRHSVLWEQAAGIGLPMILKHWEGTEHINNFNNCIFLEDDDYRTLVNTLECILLNVENFQKLKQNSKLNSENFLYSNIAKKSLEETINN